jgi:3-isopropylmalate dehydrogenase
MKVKITVLPGDGVGPEVTREAVATLEAVGEVFSHQFEFNEQLIGGVALDTRGVPLPEETLKACLASDAVFRGRRRPAV